MKRDRTSSQTIKSQTSFSRTRNIISPGRSTHLQLAQTAAKIREPIKLKLKQTTLPSLPNKIVSQLNQNTNSKLQYAFEEQRLENRALKRKNALLQSEISQLRVILQPKEQQTVLMKKLDDLQSQISIQKQKFQKLALSQTHHIDILKQQNLKLLKQSKEKQTLSSLYQQLRQVIQLKKRSINEVSQPSRQPQKLRQHDRSFLIYDQIISRKSSEIISLHDALMNCTNILNQIAKLVDDSVELNLLPGKLQYLLKHKQTIKNNEILNLQKEVGVEKSIIEGKNKEIQQMKRTFVQKIKQVSEDLNGIIQNTKKQFDSLKVQNWALLCQNKQLKAKLQAKYSSTSDMNSHDLISSANGPLPISQGTSFHSRSKKRSRKQSASPETIKHSKVAIIRTFSNWMYQWSHVGSSSQQLNLLQMLIDRPQILQNGIEKSLSQLCNFINVTLLNTSDVSVMDACIKILAESLSAEIIKQRSLHIQRVLPKVIQTLERNSKQVVKILAYCSQIINFNEETLRSLAQSNSFGIFFSYLNDQKQVINSKYDQKQRVEMIDDIYQILTELVEKGVLIKEILEHNFDAIIVKKLNTNQEYLQDLLHILDLLLNTQEYIGQLTFLKSEKDKNINRLSTIKQYNRLFHLLSTNHQPIILKIIMKLMKFQCFTSFMDIKSLIPQFITSIIDTSSLSLLIDTLLPLCPFDQHQKIAPTFQPLAKILVKNQDISSLMLRILNCIKTKVLDEFCIKEFLPLIGHPIQKLSSQIKIDLFKILKLLMERNKETLTSALSEKKTLDSFLTFYTSHPTPDGIYLNLLSVVLALKKPELQKFKLTIAKKLLQNVIDPNKKICLLGLRCIIQLSKQKGKQSQQLFSKQDINKLFLLIQNSKQEQKISLLISAIYFLSTSQKNTQQLCGSFMKIMMKIISLFPTKSIILKSLTLMQKVHNFNYKKFVLNQLVNESNLQTLKILNNYLIDSDNKIEAAQHSLFIFQSLNNPIPIQALAKNIQCSSKFGVQVLQQFVRLSERYKIEGKELGLLALNILVEMSMFNKKVKSEYQILKKRTVFQE